MFLKKLDDEDDNRKLGTTVMGESEGLFLEKPDIVDKYCRRVIHDKNPQLAEMSLIHFARMYQPIRRKTASDEHEEVDNFDDDVDINNLSENRPI